MRVNTKEPFEIVFCLFNHAQLGYLIECVAVQLMPNGEYSLLTQKLHHNTARDFNGDPELTELLRILDETEPDALIKKFNPAKKPIRSADFFSRYYTPELHNKIRPYIEKRLLRVLEKLENRKFFLVKDGTISFTPLRIEQEKAGILFHFRRNRTGTNYFATIRLGKEKINFSQNKSELIINEPAWLLCDNRLITFKKETEGNKIKPFLAKKYISIPTQSESVYFEKFVKPLIENYDVYAEGFEIRSEQYQAVPLLKLTQFGESGLCAGLYFRYGPYQFPFHSVKMVSVTLESKNDDFIFHRIRRSRQWENKLAGMLESAGLKKLEGSLFVPADKNENLIVLLNRHRSDLENAGFEIDQSGLNRVYHIGDSNISFSISRESDWFDLKALVKFGSFEIPFLRLRSHILNGKREFPLPDGSIAIIPEEWFSRYAGLMELAELRQEELRIRKHHHGLLENLFSNKEYRSGQKIPPFDPSLQCDLPAGLKAQLRPYQLTGYSWLRYMDEQGFGACLADDMGLGKTLQVLAFLQYRKEHGNAGIHSLQESGKRQREAQLNLFGNETYTFPYTENPLAESFPNCSLVVVPTSLIYNWQSESNRFTGLKIYIHSGFNRTRDICGVAASYDVIISSYGTVRNDIELFTACTFDTVVLDESQAIKNPASQTAVSINQLKSRNRIVMTGTPVENSITDLWSQINFLNPGILGNYNYFTKKFVNSIEKEKNEEETQNLKQIVRPFILRRTKEEVAQDLPDKTEKVVYCEMSEEQQQRYESIKSSFRNELLQSLQENGLRKSNIMILNGLIKLRQIANHPVLAEPEYLGSSGKFEQITSSLQNVIASGHRVLVFSQFVQHLTLLRNWLDNMQIPYYFIAGHISAAERKALVDKFQHTGQAKIFLISLKAGGTGLNLTAADYVFLLDPWWNPAVERQAMDRTHRIGQNKPVIVYKFITRDTIEEKIMHLQHRKQKVSDDILDTEAQFVNNLEQDTLKNLLE